MVKSGVWLHVNSKTTFQEYVLVLFRISFKCDNFQTLISTSCSGTEMTSYRRKDAKEQVGSDDETEPLTFLSGTKKTQIQVIFAPFPKIIVLVILTFLFLITAVV